MVTKVDICNMALDLLEEGIISSISENSAAARWFDRNFDISRDGLLEAYNWNFAIERQSIAVDATPPSWGWDHAYLIPSGALRVMLIRKGGEHNGAPIPHEIEGQYILTDEDTPLQVRCIMQQTDTTKFPSLFTEALAARMAIKQAHARTGKASVLDRAERVYSQMIKEALKSDAISGTPETPSDTDIIAIRYT